MFEKIYAINFTVILKEINIILCSSSKTSSFCLQTRSEIHTAFYPTGTAGLKRGRGVTLILTPFSAEISHE
jgi:hypothetical protein